jgi:hypothetical protein
MATGTTAGEEPEALGESESGESGSAAQGGADAAPRATRRGAQAAPRPALRPRAWEERRKERARTRWAVQAGKAILKEEAFAEWPAWARWIALRGRRAARAAKATLARPFSGVAIAARKAKNEAAARREAWERKNRARPTRAFALAWNASERAETAVDKLLGWASGGGRLRGVALTAAIVLALSLASLPSAILDCARLPGSGAWALKGPDGSWRSVAMLGQPSAWGDLATDAIAREKCLRAAQCAAFWPTPGEAVRWAVLGQAPKPLAWEGGAWEGKDATAAGAAFAARGGRRVNWGLWGPVLLIAGAEGGLGAWLFGVCLGAWRQGQRKEADPVARLAARETSRRGLLFIAAVVFVAAGSQAALERAGGGDWLRPATMEQTQALLDGKASGLSVAWLWGGPPRLAPLPSGRTAKSGELLPGGLIGAGLDVSEFWPDGASSDPKRSAEAKRLGARCSRAGACARLPGTIYAAEAANGEGARTGAASEGAQGAGQNSSARLESPAQRMSEATLAKWGAAPAARAQWEAARRDSRERAITAILMCSVGVAFALARTGLLPDPGELEALWRKRAERGMGAARARAEREELLSAAAEAGNDGAKTEKATPAAGRAKRL